MKLDKIKFARLLNYIGARFGCEMSIERGFDMLVLSGPTEIFVDAFCPQDKHIQAFRLHWHMRGVEIKTNGQVFNLRGVPQYGKSYEQVAREYGR